MRTLFVLLLICIAALFLANYVIEPSYTLLARVPAQLREKQFHEARHECERILKLRPSLFAETANNKLGVAHLTAAQSEMEKNNYSAAQDWLTGLLDRSGAPTGSEDRARQLLKELPRLHYRRAHELFLAKDYETALVEYQQIERLYKSDPILDHAKHEFFAAEIESARAMNASADPETALDRLNRLSQSPRLPPLMVTRALQDVPDLSERAIRGRINRHEFDAAFALMENLPERFPDPEIAPRLREVIARFDLELFNVALEAPDRQRKASDSAPAATSVAGDEKVIFRARNETGYPLRLVYADSQQRVEIAVPAHATREVALAPGRYLAGVYWPGERRFRPKREQMTFRAGESVEKIFRLAPRKGVTQEG